MQGANSVPEGEDTYKKNSFPSGRVHFLFHLFCVSPSIYTVESVTSGHSDKVCGQISDAILDAYLAQNSMSHVAVECFGGHGLLVIGGEAITRAEVHFEEVARHVLLRAIE
ncbi:hypothetical protein COX00_03825 [Candidatus Uhrbacteria bacterium CG22_combo_CG10-13_8_21_14_all_47_17]|uniref:S-adenosylmethionine synthetase N-terminal domain-containing protein n=1 Tax=Candidatus Uhrbacteria bacterium CG22_combo_CG10-13_8_21_14_all_47_17 TaxID=1975041 RepID=A0A2H0BS03_9BACT|nr:MAG: hypothetical protein COX00_03825 [Candidatus Uhrbacteria bacterium CG22_combo_CG10-13_8_21_14_all_47_17]